MSHLPRLQFWKVYRAGLCKQYPPNARPFLKRVVVYDVRYAAGAFLVHVVCWERLMTEAGYKCDILNKTSVGGQASWPLSIGG